MRRMLEAATVMTMMLVGTIVPVGATVMPMSILVTKTDPTSEPETLAGILDGTIAAGAHATTMALGVDRLEIGGVTSVLAPSSLASVPLASDRDDEAFPAFLTVAAEPSTLLLVGTGVAGLAGMVRRRLARRR